MTKVTAAGFGNRLWARGRQAGITILFNNLHHPRAKTIQTIYYFALRSRSESAFMPSVNYVTRHLRLFCQLCLVLIPLFPRTRRPERGACHPEPGSHPNQVPTSAQNPVYGSVPEAKPTPGILSLTFSEAIEQSQAASVAELQGAAGGTDLRQIMPKSQLRAKFFTRLAAIMMTIPRRSITNALPSPGLELRSGNWGQRSKSWEDDPRA